jgi:hypothetical protein
MFWRRAWVAKLRVDCVSVSECYGAVDEEEHTAWRKEARATEAKEMDMTETLSGF